VGKCEQWARGAAAEPVFGSARREWIEMLRAMWCGWARNRSWQVRDTARKRASEGKSRCETTVRTSSGGRLRSDVGMLVWSIL